MTREHLLEAMGLLDDDLIKEAEEPVRRKKWNRDAWISLAACLALVLTIGYGAVHNGWGSANSSSGSSSAGATAEDWAGGTGENAASSGTAAVPGEAESGDGSSNSDQSGEMLILMVPVGDHVYSYQHTYEQDQVLETLPKGCRSLGQVGSSAGGENTPYTDGDVYLGCELWIAGEGWDGPVYLETPEGVYLECIKG